MNTPYDSLYLFIGGKWFGADGRETATVRNPVQTPSSTLVKAKLQTTGKLPICS
ncbi:hypothetical protein [Pseudomonas sp. TDA1]|uniref:hypothetical protein n=1 Tax=Pseudomonas sp. TDA1 TaxID=2681304 RepID=UPI0012E11DA7|nr:hypothetical protein [Pseudomonas sp. TDA1]MUT49714.1 hypothetical protein [Pseudomonas sp. TDA1]